MTYTKDIHDLIDRRRRDVIQRRDKAKNETSEMYYEGMRVALGEIQALVQQYVTLENGRDS